MQFLSRGLSNVGLGTTPLATQLTASSPSTSTTILAPTASSPPRPSPSSALDYFIPGYSTISSLILNTIGFDVTLLVSASLIGFGLVKAISFVKNQATSLILNYAACSITVPIDVEAYRYMMDWLAHREIGSSSRDLVSLPLVYRPTLLEIFSNRMNPQKEEQPPAGRKGVPTHKYEPAVGVTHYFWYDGTLFLWLRMREKRMITSSMTDIPTLEVFGKLYCLGRSTAPLKAVIDAATAFNHEKTAAKTVIRRPAPAKQRKEGGQPWKTAATRPSRPMETVVLGETEKNMIVEDIEEYLLPTTREWYSQRGIPYRRGYLFHGEPGTGKTSLSFALAGVFGLDVYCISLQEPTITEEDLATLFEKLPEQCLVLLEDVDSAGLVVRDNSSVTKPTDAEESNTPDSSRISLSGLLNIIDGVASHEGRVLIMTTNHIEKLDAALLRPGRIDVRIEFELATKSHAESLFIQIFATRPQSVDGVDGMGGILSVKKLGSVHVTDEINAMARSFAENIPEKTLSPAEIQGFLIKWKNNPSEALARSQAWVESALSSSHRP